MDPNDGAISALVGGFDFYASNFNRAVQARRQPGSSFKPLLYSAALEHGFTPASIINDAPFVTEDPSLEGTWRPKNNTGTNRGPTRLREALYRSLNNVSVRIMNSIGPEYATQYIQRFGLTPEELPAIPSLALGTTTVSPLRMAGAYAVFANGGHRVESYFVDRVEDSSGKELLSSTPKFACSNCPQAAPATITEQNAYLMTDMMADVIRRGTAVRALQLKRGDLAGKTGTTQDGRDTWFCGYNADLVGVAWVGFDQERSLGRGEQGSSTALPIWIKFMSEALQGLPEHRLPAPSGLVNLRISAATGKPARPGDPDAMFETFMAHNVPESDPADVDLDATQTDEKSPDDSLF
jgi:penicillin-binding protein 1A